MQHRLESRWFFPSVSLSEAPGKESSCLSYGRWPVRSFRLMLAAILIFPGALSLPVQAALDKSIVKSQEGSSALLRGRYDLAIAAFDDALKDANLSPARQAAIYSDRGVAKWRMKQFDGALADFTKAVSLNPDYPTAYNNRGSVYMDLNRTDDAYKDFDHAIAIAPAFGPAYNNRGNANQS